MAVSAEEYAKNVLVNRMTVRILGKISKINSLSSEEICNKYQISEDDLNNSSTTIWNDSNREMFDSMSLKEKDEVTKRALNWFVENGIIDRWSTHHKNEYSLYCKDDEGIVMPFAKVIAIHGLMVLSIDELTAIGWPIC